MSRFVNKIILVGTIGCDPDVQVFDNDSKTAHISLQTCRPQGDSDAIRSDWHRVTMYNRLASFCENYVSKGARVYIEGVLQYDSYERDGITIPTADVIAREVVLLSADVSPERAEGRG